MENKILVILYVPFMEKKYELYVHVGTTIREMIYLIEKALVDVTGGYYESNNTNRIYNRESGKEYNLNEYIKYTNIRNGTELLFM